MQVKKLTLIVGLIAALGCIAAVKVDAPVYVTKLVPTSADFFVMIDAADGKQKKTPVLWQRCEVASLLTVIRYICSWSMRAIPHPQGMALYKLEGTAGEVKAVQRGIITRRESVNDLI